VSLDASISTSRQGLAAVMLAMGLLSVGEAEGVREEVQRRGPLAKVSEDGNQGPGALDERSDMTIRVIRSIVT
jgi:hypothetical protein